MGRSGHTRVLNGTAATLTRIIRSRSKRHYSRLNRAAKKQMLRIAHALCVCLSSVVSLSVSPGRCGPACRRALFGSGGVSVSPLAASAHVAAPGPGGIRAAPRLPRRRSARSGRVADSVCCAIVAPVHRAGGSSLCSAVSPSYATLQPSTLCGRAWPFREANPGPQPPARRGIALCHARDWRRVGQLSKRPSGNEGTSR